MTETRALLLTDIVDSTTLSEKIGDRAIADVWSAHDRAARDLLRLWRGREIDKTDGMLLMFDAAADAVSYAMAYHRALAGLPTPLTARAGLHVGSVILRENSAEDVSRGAKPLEVEGFAKPTAARTMSLARGGQILLTSEARAALGETTLKIRSHGHWAMKGVSEPTELFEIGDEQTHFAAPPDSNKVYRVVRVGERWLPVVQVPNNLPQQATSFIGRSRELDEIKALLEKARLITLLGMGGLGKTRLSLHVAAELMPRFPDGVWFVDLSPLTDPSLLASTVAHSVGVNETPQVPVDVALLNHLKHTAALLILDNCEQIARACAELVRTLLESTLQLRIVATSREALHLRSEFLYALDTLSFPAAISPEAGATRAPAHSPVESPRPRAAPGERLQAARDSAAVRLFVDRARQTAPSFELTTENVEVVIDICAHLDGVPLAIELAAARIALLGVDGIREKLYERFRLLVAPDGARVERHRTLRHAIDWSYQLLGVEEQRLLRRLGVFAGGFTLEGAHSVAAEEGGDEWELLDRLGALLDKSMVVSDRKSTPRYRMLDSIRKFAIDQLNAGHDEGESWRRFDAYFESLAVAAEADLLQGGEVQLSAIARLDAERDNLRTILSQDHSDSTQHDVAAQLCGRMYRYWLLNGQWREGLAWCDQVAMHAATLPDSVRAKLLLGAGALSYRLGQYDAAEGRLHGALEAAESVGDALLNGRILVNLGNIAADLGEAERARGLYERAAGAARTAGSEALEAMALVNAGRLAYMNGNREAARPILVRALQLSRSTDNLQMEAFVLSYQCGMARFEGQLELARELHRKMADLARHLGGPDLLLQAKCNSAMLLIAGGKFADGARELSEILAAPGVMDNPFVTAECLGHLVLAAEGLRCWERVARFHAAAAHVDSVAGRQIFKDDKAERERANERSRQELGVARHALASEEGNEASLQDLITDVQAWVAELTLPNPLS